MQAKNAGVLLLADYLRREEGCGYYEEVAAPLFFQVGREIGDYQLSVIQWLIHPRDAGKMEDVKLNVLLLCISIVFMLPACSSAPVVETVTTDASRSSALPADAQPVALEPNLPARDPDIEAAGDRIAEAITYLNTRRRDRREVALRALNQAETTLTRALRNGSHAESIRTILHSTLKDLDSAEHAVQRNAPDAIKQLTAINKNLDGMNEKQEQSDQQSSESTSQSPE